MKNRIIDFTASWMGLGYAPFASGTFGTLGALPLILILQNYCPCIYFAFVIAFIPLAAWSAGAAEKLYNKHDSGLIVIDEVAGYMITMFMLPLGAWWLLYGFFMFRAFDVLKLWPAGAIDRTWKGGWGVVLDDVFAGIYANLALQALRLIGF